MPNLRCFQIPGITAQEVLNEFNERAGEFGITDEADIVSVSVIPTRSTIPIHAAQGSVNSKVEVVIVYWTSN